MKALLHAIPVPLNKRQSGRVGICRLCRMVNFAHFQRAGRISPAPAAPETPLVVGTPPQISRSASFERGSPV